MIFFPNSASIFFSVIGCQAPFMVSSKTPIELPEWVITLIMNQSSESFFITYRLVEMNTLQLFAACQSTGSKCNMAIDLPIVQ